MRASRALGVAALALTEHYPARVLDIKRVRRTVGAMRAVMMSSRTVGVARCRPAVGTFRYLSGYNPG